MKSNYLAVAVLVILWLLGLATGLKMGGLIHVLIVTAVAILLYSMLPGRKHTPWRRGAFNFPALNRIASLVLLIGGVGIILFGAKVPNAFGADSARYFTGSQTEKAVWLFLAGGFASIAGLYLTLRSRRATQLTPAMRHHDRDVR